jgi:hypothetical protein
MKTFRLLSRCIIGTLLSLVLPATIATGGATVVRSRVDDFSSPFTLTDPCNGEVVEGVVEGGAHLVFITDPTGGEHVDLFSVVHGTGVGDLGNTYVATQTLSATGTATVNGVTVITAVIDQPFISRGPADNLMVHLLAHFTITPNGTAVDFTVTSVECRGRQP